jgi:membrane-associated protease RseP (regulator of RpoE activity)
LNVLWFYAIAFIIVWVLAFLFRDRLKIDITGPLLMRRTQKLRGLIDSVANRSPRFWRWGLNIGLPIAIFFMALMLYFLVISLQTLLQAPQVQVLLPGVDIPGSPIVVPLGYGIIALMTVMVVHEFGHGIISRVEGVKIKSIGVLLLAVLPGAFVEPDEEDIKKSKRISKLRIYAAGSVFNLSLAAIALLITFIISSFVIAPAFHTDGVGITSVVPKSPADGILTQGMVIQSINGVQITDINSYVSVLNTTKVGDNVTFKTNQGVYSIKAGVNPNNSTRGYIGIRSQSHLVVNSYVAKTFGDQIPWFFYSLNDLFYWIFLLNFAIGTFNLLPMKPLDGGLLLEELLGYKLSSNMVQKITNPLSYFLIVIIAVSIVYSLGRGISMLL